MGIFFSEEDNKSKENFISNITEDGFNQYPLINFLKNGNGRLRQENILNDQHIITLVELMKIFETGVIMVVKNMKVFLIVMKTSTIHKLNSLMVVDILVMYIMD